MTFWLASKTAKAPTALRERVAALVQEQEDGAGGFPDRLARAATHALHGVVVRPGDRSVALDLLSADALITLALLYQAEEDPARLGEYARELVAGPLELTER